jgi:nitrite reductase/ring-hydroxylating ferredoxin subunit
MAGEFGRRDLLQGSLAFMGAAPLCCVTPEAPIEAVSFDGPVLRLDVSRVHELRRVGGAVTVVDAERKLNLLVAHAEKGRFVALDRVCTHGGAMCTYNHKRRSLRCTSLNHAEYDLNGTLLHGRTHGNLRAYAVRVLGGHVEIEWERRS